MATRTDPQLKTPVGPASPAEPDEPPRPRFDDRIEGDPIEALSKYEEVTLPPHARLKWLSAELPSAPPELLQDTVPPNGGVRAPAKPDVEQKADPTPVAEPSRPAASTAKIKREPAPAVAFPDPLRDQQTVLIPRVRRKRRLQGIVVLALGGAMLLTVVGLLVHWLSADNQAGPAVVPPPVEALAPVTAQPTPLAQRSASVPTATAAAPVPSANFRDKPTAESKPAASHGPRPGHAPKPASAPSPGRPPATNDFDTSKPWED